MSQDSMLQIQVWDEDWVAYIDLEDFSSLRDKAKLTCKVKVRPEEVDLPTVNESSLLPSSNTSVQRSNIMFQPKRNWPDPFKFPVASLPKQVLRALEENIDLNKPANRYLRGLLLQTLCNEAVSIKSHPERHEKVSLAKSIINEWGYLKEQYGKGWEGWLTSIVDGQARKRTGQAKVIQKRTTEIANTVMKMTDPEWLTILHLARGASQQI